MPRTSTQDLQEEFLTTIRKGQETVLDALKTWVETVRTVTPKLPSSTARSPKLPNVAVPSPTLPSPREAVDNTYRLAEQLLDNQRKFAEDVLKLTEPLIPGHAEHHGDQDRPEARRARARRRGPPYPSPKADVAPAPKPPRPAPSPSPSRPRRSPPSQGRSRSPSRSPR